jgi:lia operon protein LiaG
MSRCFFGGVDRGINAGGSEDVSIQIHMPGEIPGEEKKLKTKIIIAIGVLAILGILSGTGAKYMYREISDEKTIDLKKIDDIQVNMTGAAVHLIRTETGDEARFHYYGKSLQEITLVPEINDKTLLINARRKYIFLGTCENMRLDIFLPGAYQQNLSIKTSSGAVKTDAFDLAEFTLNTTSGGLESEGINAGKINLYTTSGNLNIRKMRANELEIKGTSSSVGIGECRVKEAKVKVTSGSVKLEKSQGDLDIRGTSGNVMITCREFQDRNIAIETTSGGVTLRLPPTAGFFIDAQMTSGKLQSDFPIDNTGNTFDRKVSGQTGSSNKISIQTKSGQIKILKNDE